ARDQLDEVRADLDRFSVFEPGAARHFFPEIVRQPFRRKRTSGLDLDVGMVISIAKIGVMDCHDLSPDDRAGAQPASLPIECRSWRVAMSRAVVRGRPSALAIAAPSKASPSAISTSWSVSSCSGTALSS